MASNRFQSLSAASNLRSEIASQGSPSLSTGQATPDSQKHPRKRKGHRGGKKKRSRRKSFAALTEDSHDEAGPSRSGLLYQVPEANLSGTSIDSEVLLDHREQRPMRTRRSSTIAAQSSFHNPFASTPGGSRLRSMHTPNSPDANGERDPWDETAPLLSASAKRGTPTGPSSYGASESRTARNRSPRSSRSSKTKLAPSQKDGYDVNHPPSVPGSPAFRAATGPEMVFGDVMIRDDLSLPSGMSGRCSDNEEAVSDTEGSIRDHKPEINRRTTVDAPVDVCFPAPGMSELGEEEDDAQSRDPQIHRRRARRRHGQWPDLSVLEEWRHYEKEDRSEERRVKRITEPQLINGRLRPVRKGWFQTDEEIPYRFTYFNEEFQSTIHSQTISELVQPGSDFRELFIPDPRILSDDESSDSDNENISLATRRQRSFVGPDVDSKLSTRQPSIADSRKGGAGTMSPSLDPLNHSRRVSPSGVKSPAGSAYPAAADTTERPIRYGDRPVWWLDVLSPTEAEMKVIATAFGIHPLTAEDIMLQEAREKVELFRHYYFVNYRTFDQDINSANYLEPVNMYVVVFREGVLSFHFSMTPHPANVRRRIRQLRDYLILSSDWISYAIIDDITDVFQPLIQNIEDEVDEIDENILRMHTPEKDEKTAHLRDDSSSFFDSGDMLRRVGDCRKRVMSLYRLLGNKADVIKGFAKRCNESWEVAPRILARSHGNYLAQINIRMNERQEQTADVLGRLTVLGTIVLPMNIITGLWGMNVWVPGQQYEGDLSWFAWITAGLLLFGLACYMIAKRVYKIV
ncbi:CorA family metal ion transporter [Metarhizium album ARSEF 1941]|uniref:CorA family metal ion transporter n=1 Tax=Metarhizium album (strain ARSEF 1941) TaxID=1081103 RepID=A0A0B2WSM4_METAS|nr:CorA family metal ion transporter [Metarhizium album ARSEF 1941]KHN96487.1 CorA family metal ion transporter [Metarhizium album ARSEF 1941]